MTIKTNKSDSIKITRFALIIITCYSLVFANYWKFWRNDQTPFAADSSISYWYVPATFIYHNYTKCEEGNSYIYPDANGRIIPKYTYGMALMYSPFFFIGHGLSILSGEKLDGYSHWYRQSVHYGCIVYGLLGFLFLSFVLRKYFSDIITAIVLLLLFFGTNLMSYILIESERVHGILFFLISVFLWLTIKWYENPNFKKSMLLGLVSGIIAMIRPTDILIIMVFLLYGIKTSADLKKQVNLYIHHKWQIITIALSFFLLLIPQLVFWKIYTGDFIHYTYNNEKFFWLAPKLIKLLFSYRNGWFLYTPVMAFAFLGLFISKKIIPEHYLSFIFYILLNLYVLSCWWCWWYMGFGMRSVIQSYPIMALGLASFLTYLSNRDYSSKFFKSIAKISAASIFVGFICINLIQTLQYKKYIINGEYMNKKTYWASFCKLSWTEEEFTQYKNSFPKIDNQAAIRGKR